VIKLSCGSAANSWTVKLHLVLVSIIDAEEISFCVAAVSLLDETVLWDKVTLYLDLACGVFVGDVHVKDSSSM